MKLERPFSCRNGLRKADLSGCEPALLPRERIHHDSIDVIVARPPVQLFNDAAAVSDDLCAVTWTPWRIANGEGRARRSANRADDFANGIPTAIAAVQNQAPSALAKVSEGKPVSFHQIRDMDVIAYARAIGCRVVGSEDVDMIANTEGRLAGNLMRCVALGEFWPARPCGSAPATLK